MSSITLTVSTLKATTYVVKAVLTEGDKSCETLNTNLIATKLGISSEDLAEIYAKNNAIPSSHHETPIKVFSREEDAINTVKDLKIAVKSNAK